MMKVDLFTRGGEYVSSTNIPPYKTLEAVVIQWGARIFIYDKEQDKFMEGLLTFGSNEVHCEE